MKSTFFILSFLIVSKACTVTTGNAPEPIVFGAAVGNYKGYFTTCTFQITAPEDSLCQEKIADVFRVVIADKNHIHLRSEQNLILPLKIPFVGSADLQNSRILNFNLSNENVNHFLSVNTGNGVLEYTCKSKFLTGQKSEFFEGIK